MRNTTDLLTRTIDIELRRRNMSRKDLAAQVGFTETALSNRMTGRVSLDLNDLDKIATALGMSAFELVAAARAESHVSSGIPA